MGQHHDPLRYTAPALPRYPHDIVANAVAHTPVPVGFISIHDAAKTRVAFEEAQKKEEQVVMFHQALQELCRIQRVPGLDPEVTDADFVRLRELGSRSGSSEAFEGSSENRQQAKTQGHKHPNLEIFPWESARSLAKSNYELIMNSLTTNYCVYEGWKTLGLEPIPNNSGPSAATHYYSAQQLGLVTHGTRLDWDGTTPLPEQGTISFHVRDDMFQTWLENHQTKIGCTFNKTTSAPVYFSHRSKMRTANSWKFVCSCYRTLSSVEDAKGKVRGRKYGLLGCKAKLTAYSGIMKPAPGDDDECEGARSRTMVGLTLVVYTFDHSHDLHARDVAKEKRGKKYEEVSEEDTFRRERLEELSQQLRTILVRGTSIREASSLLGENARRCREMSRARGKMMLSRGDFLTRRDVISVLGYIAGVGADEVLDMVEEWDVEEEDEEEEDLTAEQVVETLEVSGRRQRGLGPPQGVAPELMATFLGEEVGAFLGEEMVEEIVEEPAITVTRATPTRVQEPTRSSTTTDSVDLLRRYVDECDSSDFFAPCMDRVKALVDRLVALKRLPDLPPLADTQQGLKRRRRV